MLMFTWISTLSNIYSDIDIHRYTYKLVGINICTHAQQEQITSNLISQSTESSSQTKKTDNLCIYLYTIHYNKPNQKGQKNIHSNRCKTFAISMLIFL
jgi:hypothetical protein